MSPAVCQLRLYHDTSYHNTNQHGSREFKSVLNKLRERERERERVYLPVLGLGLGIWIGISVGLGGVFKDDEVDSWEILLADRFL